MEKYRYTTVGALLKALCGDLQQAYSPEDAWCMYYTAETAEFMPGTPCYASDYPDFGDAGFVHLPPDALRQGMSAYLTDELLCDVVSELLSRRNAPDAETLTAALNYYLAHDSFLPQDGKTLHQLDEILHRHEWEHGFQVPRGILAEPACDLSLALEIFYRSGGYDFLEENRRALNSEALVFLSMLYGHIKAGKYQKSMRHYAVPLTKIQRYKLERKQVPAVFLTDL